MTNPLRLLTLALLVGSAFGLTDCKKKSEPEPDKRSQREIWLTGTGWQRQSIIDTYTTPAGVVTSFTTPLSAYFPTCALDDLTHFNANRTLTVDDGPQQCQPTPSPSTTTWDFTANETEILFNGTPPGRKISALTATSLALDFTETDPTTGVVWVQTQTYVAK